MTEFAGLVAVVTGDWDRVQDVLANIGVGASDTVINVEPSDAASNLMIMGLGAQLVAWDPNLCEAFSDRGFGRRERIRRRRAGPAPQHSTPPLENPRRVAHIISDAIYTRVTGEAGYFDSRVVFVDESGPKNQRVKRLAIMDQDGANVRYLTRGEDLVCAWTKELVGEETVRDDPQVVGTNRGDRITGTNRRDRIMALREANKYNIHIDRHLAEIIADYGIWTYAVLFAIIFASGPAFPTANAPASPRSDDRARAWRGGRSACGDLAVQELANDRCHHVQLVLQREMAGVQQVQVRMRQIAQIGIGTFSREDLVVATPDDQRRRLIAAKEGLELGV